MEIATLKAEEAEQVSRLKKELQHESDEAVRKRAEDMRRMNMIFQENDKQRAIKEARFLREKEEDATA